MSVLQSLHSNLTAMRTKSRLKKIQSVADAEDLARR